MKPESRQLILLVVILTIILSFSLKLNATGDASFYFKLNNVFARFYVAFGTTQTAEEAQEGTSRMNYFFNTIDLSLKYLFAIEKYSEKTDLKISINYYCNAWPLKKLTEVELRDELIKQAKINDSISIAPLDFFEGYTLCLESVSDWKSYKEKKGNWLKKLDPILDEINNDNSDWELKLTKNDWLGLFYVEESDGMTGIIFPRLWSYGQLNEEFEIRFGLYAKKEDALKAAMRMNLDRNQITIRPVKMNFDSFKIVVMDRMYSFF